MAKEKIQTAPAAAEKPAPNTVTIVIPIDPLNKNDLSVPYKLDSRNEHFEGEITRGVPTAVPIPVYEVLKDSGYITGLN